MIVLKNKWKYDVFCIFGKDGISFSYKHEITLLPKKQNCLLPKNTLKNGISGITKKDDVHPRKDDIEILD